jgi:nucleoside phosphorylase
MTTHPHSDRWSVRHAFQAARAVRRAEFGQQAIDTVRPRGVVGFARRRAPLAIMLYLAAWEGRLCGPDSDGFAILEPPVRAGGRGWGRRYRGPWLLRLLDRRWDTVVFALPVGALALATAAVAVLVAGPAVWWLAGALGAYLVALAAARAVASLGWLSRFTELAQLGGVGRNGRVSGARPADHWSMALCHQTRPERTDDLLRQVAARLNSLVSDQAVAAAQAGRGRTGDSVETLVCLTGGITTADVRSLVATSAMAVAPDPDDGDVVVLLAPTYPVPAGRIDPARPAPASGAALFAWYLCGLVVASLANARYIAITEHESFGAAARFLAGRLLFSDSVFGVGEPVTWGAAALGFTTSLAGVATAAFGLVAARTYLATHHQLREDSDAAMTDVITRSRVLILVVTAHERDAVIDAVVARTGRAPVASTDGDRTIFALGKVGGADLLLAQAGEGGTSSEAGMGGAARAAIRLCRPDYVVLVGTCYGLRPDDDEQRIGDILVSQRVESLDRQRVADRFGGTRVLSRGVDLGPSPILLERCRSAQHSWSRHRARIHFGLILSSSPLASSPQPIGDLRRHHPDAVGGESESSGVYDAAARHKTHWVMVKAISDWGAGRSEEFEDIAARNAADFATHMVAIGSLQQP